jgi:hypothetical protein
MRKLTTTLLALGFAAAAVAQQPDPHGVQTPPRADGPQQQPKPRQERQAVRPAPSFEAADKNKDGALSRQEASAVPGLDFAAADTNNSQTLDFSEYMAAITKFSATPRG